MNINYNNNDSHYLLMCEEKQAFYSGVYILKKKRFLYARFRTDG